MNTDVNYNPFAPARSLSLQFMIQAVTTSFDPILVMLIFPHNGSKSVWFNCGNCVSASRVCVWEECLLSARVCVCLPEWSLHAWVCVCVTACSCKRSELCFFVREPKLPICILMSLACHIKLLQWCFKPRLCFQEHYTERGTKGLKSKRKRGPCNEIIN